MKVYKVYDEEWEEIMGKKQVIEFMTDQILNNFCFEDIEDKDSELYCYTSNFDRKILKKIFENKKISFNEAVKILPVRSFYIKEIEVY